MDDVEVVEVLSSLVVEVEEDEVVDNLLVVEPDEVEVASTEVVELVVVEVDEVELLDELDDVDEDTFTI